MIYVLQSEIGGPVKIGYTSRAVEGRLREIQPGCPWPLRVVASWPGTLKDEAAIHARFNEQRLHGEWFRLAGDLPIFIAANNPRKTLLEGASNCP